MDIEELEIYFRKLSLRDEDVILWEVGDEGFVASNEDIQRVTKFVEAFQKQYQKSTGKKIFNLVLPTGLVHSIKSITVNRDLANEVELRKRLSTRKNLYSSK